MNVIVMTTVNEPRNLSSLLRCKKEDTIIVIATDRKTPRFDISDKNIHILSIKDQIKLLRNPLGVPFDSIQRRNCGYIYAIKELNPDIIITVDDDNEPIDNVWEMEHEKALSNMSRQPVLLEQANVVEYLLDFSCGIHDKCSVGHRGTPLEWFSVYNYKHNMPNIQEQNRTIGVNAGMWLKDPDVDAYTRLLHPYITSSIGGHCWPNPKVVIDPSIFVYPFNSQNTSFSKAVFPAIFLIPMGGTVFGKKFGRYDDIWQSFICQRVMAHRGLCVRYGTPYVIQDRNNHDIVDDLDQEFPGMLLNNRFVDTLSGIDLYGSSIEENMYEIADGLLKSSEEVFKFVGNKVLWWLEELGLSTSPD